MFVCLGFFLHCIEHKNGIRLNLFSVPYTILEPQIVAHYTEHKPEVNGKQAVLHFARDCSIFYYHVYMRFKENMHIFALACMFNSTRGNLQEICDRLMFIKLPKQCSKQIFFLYSWKKIELVICHMIYDCLTYDNHMPSQNEQQRKLFM